MVITNKIEIALDRRGVEEIIDAVQGDENSREVAISLKNNGEDWPIPDGVTAIIGYRRKDGSGNTYDTLSDGTPAYKYQGNVLTIVLAPQVLVAPGKIEVTACIIQDGVKLNTFSICVNVQPNNGLQNNGKDTYKFAGTVPDSGWTPNKYLGSDENGNVVEKDAPAGTDSADVVSAISITEAADGTVTMVNTTESGNTETIVITPDMNGNPYKLTYNGKEIPIRWAVSE